MKLGIFISILISIVIIGICIFVANYCSAEEIQRINELGEYLVIRRV